MMKQEKSDILKAVEQLAYGIEKLDELDPEAADIDPKILDNRVITLEGYLRYLDQDGINILKKILEKIEGDNDVR